MNIELFPIKPDKPFSKGLVKYFAQLPNESFEACKKNGYFSSIRPYDFEKLLEAIEKERQQRAKENEIGDYRLKKFEKQNKETKK
jgi:hypothetical protein